MIKYAAAVHEAGHIVAACLVGLYSESVRITESGDGELRINYGELKRVATMMMTMDICPEFLVFLRQLNKDAVSDFAKRLCIVLVAGGIAEEIYRVGPHFSGTAEVELTGPDLTRADAISKQFEIKLDQEMESMYAFIKHDEVWAAVTALKEAILKSANNCLNAPDIDRILEISGFKSFLEQA